MPPEPVPTARQREVLAFVRDHQRRSGHPPTTREVQAHFGFASQTAAVDHLRALARKGLLQRLAGKARGLLALPSPLTTHAALVEIPLYGTIPAGRPTATEQEPDSYVSVDAAALGVRPSARLFALRVRGDSMTGAGILDGDLVFVTPREPHSGQIVAALIDGESTLKRFLMQRSRPFLRAENPRYPDLLPATELVIQGVMVGLLRRQPHE
jgi:repressor LexA